MSYVDTPADYPFPWYMRLIFFLQRRNYGRELEPSRLWGRTPRAFLAMSLMHRALERKSSPIEASLRCLLRVRVSQINGCAFCVDLNSATSLRLGVSEQKLVALPRFAESPLFTEREKAALTYAEAMTYSKRRSDAALIERLKGMFDDEGVIELTAVIAYQNMSSKFNTALGVAPQGFCHLPSGQSVASAHARTLESL